MTNHFGTDNETAKNIIETFFLLSEKSTFLKDFFNCELLSKADHYETLIIETSKMLN